MISSGIVTASEFAGDGSALTGVIGIGSGFVVQDSGSAVGTAATVNFADFLSVQFSTGIATVVGSAGTENIRTNTNATFLQNVTVVGTSTVTGNIVPSSDSATDIGTNSVRFQNIYGAAGHPNCVFKINFENLQKITNGEVNDIVE